MNKKWINKWIKNLLKNCFILINVDEFLIEWVKS